MPNPPKVTILDTPAPEQWITLAQEAVAWLCYAAKCLTYECLGHPHRALAHYYPHNGAPTGGIARGATDSCEHFGKHSTLAPHWHPMEEL